MIRRPLIEDKALVTTEDDLTQPPKILILYDLAMDLRAGDAPGPGAAAADARFFGCAPPYRATSPFALDRA